MRFFLCLLVMLQAVVTTGQAEPPKALAGQWAHVSVTDSDIEDLRRWQELQSWVERAQAEGAVGVVLELNVMKSPAQPFLQFAEAVSHWKLKTKAYVNTSAIGAGALLALACDEIWMAPGSRVGAAAPKMDLDESMSAKAQDTVIAEALAVLKAGARGLAKIKGHRPEVAEAFVDRDKGLSLGGATFAEKGELLLLDADEAVAASEGNPLLAKGIAKDFADLTKLAALGGKTVALTSSWFEELRLAAEASSSSGKVKPPGEQVVVPALKTPVVSRTESYKGKVVVIPVGQEDLIVPARFEFMKRTLGLCDAQGAEAVVFDLDTPGGLAWDTISLMMKDLQHLKTPSFAFVNPRAISAGALIAMATDAIYMAPASAIGASTPVSGNGESLGEAERAKTNSAVLGMVRSVVREKGHDVRIVEGMIDMDRGLVINGRIIIPKGEIVTLDAEQATMVIDGKPLLAKGIAKNLEELKQREGLTGAVLVAEPTGFERIAIWVTRYAAILILVGLAGGYLEMQAPGFGIPGFIAVAAFSLFFFGHYVAGSLAGQETMVVSAIFVIGIALVAVELFAAPGTILPGVLGFVCVMIALVYSMSGWEIAPSDPESPASFGQSIGQYAAGLRNFTLGVGGAAVVIALLAMWLPALRPFRALVNTASAGGSILQTPAMVAVSKIQPGAQGTTRSAMRPYGTVEIEGTLVEASADGTYLDSGVPVKVREVRGDKIVVVAS